MSRSRWTLDLAESGRLPDSLLRVGIRRLLRERLREIDTAPEPRDLGPSLSSGPLAIATDAANEQHYELPPEFFATVLGRRLKYSCCFWEEGTLDLDAAEEAALEQVCERAEIEDGMRVLDLGCGWGSLSLWIAERLPRCRVTAVSNSAPQGEFIRAQARHRGVEGVEVVTSDINDFRAFGAFDRIVSIEMFEHMRNYSLLLERIASWLEPEGKLFAHHFCHRSRHYSFEDRGPNDWMARHFFTGGLMPSEHLLEEFAGPLRLERRWRLGGRHYEETALAWLERLDANRPRIKPLLAATYGEDSERWFQRWRIFFLACAEMFGYRRGEEWFVSHSLWSADSSDAGRRPL